MAEPSHEDAVPPHPLRARPQAADPGTGARARQAADLLDVLGPGQLAGAHAAASAIDRDWPLVSADPFRCENVPGLVVEERTYG